MSETDKRPQNSTETAGSNAPSENAVFQNGQRVAEAAGVRVDREAREIHFDEIYHSDELLIPDDCDFREYRILIQKIGFASRQQPGAVHQGRVLKDVVAEILGYRQQ